jgi:hypothetical protein
MNQQFQEDTIGLTIVPEFPMLDANGVFALEKGG